MVPQEPSVDWIISQTLVYDRTIEARKIILWSPWIWRFIRFGIPLIIVWGILGVYVPVLIAEVRYQARMTAVNFKAVVPRGVLMPTASWQPIPPWVQGYALEIPKLNIQEQVVENVDAGNKQNYMRALTQGVAHAGGSGAPGEGRVQYYFAHSSGLPFWGGRAVTFATLYKLERGDDILIYKEGKRYHYQVVEKLVVKPDDLRMLTELSTDERVVLQTCWPIGTSLERLLVVAERI